ncbi:hypothetical protein WG66_008671 [Moniliophthora roreri]|nr:hypothetical protein WG66_008671 [Moniliophthora roreri]
MLLRANVLSILRGSSTSISILDLLSECCSVARAKDGTKSIELPANVSLAAGDSCGETALCRAAYNGARI